MKAILIDPIGKTVTEVEHNGDYKQIYELIDVSLFTIVQIDDVNAIYVDDEGLLNSPRYFFMYEGFHQPLAGKGLILGTNDEGESIAATLSVEEVRKKVAFTELSVEGFAPLPEGMVTGPDHPMGPNVPVIGHTPIFGPPVKDD